MPETPSLEQHIIIVNTVTFQSLWFICRYIFDFFYKNLDSSSKMDQFTSLLRTYHGTWIQNQSAHIYHLPNERWIL